MTDKCKKTLRVAYHVAITAALVVAGVCLIAACVAIYRTGPNPGDQPFSREVVAAAFAPIALPVWICLGLAVLGFVLHPLLPENPAPKAYMTGTLLKNKAARVDLAACPADLAAAVNKERRLRKIHRTVTLALLAVGAAVFLWYALDMDHFHVSQISPAMVSATWVLLPCVGVPFAYGVFAAYAGRCSEKRELQLLNTAPAEATRPAPAPVPAKEKWLAVARCALVGFALGLMVGGYMKDGWADVLTKAINICTECIGLG